MKKILLTVCMAVIAITMNAQLADKIAGTYTGDLKVTLGANPDEPIETNGEQVILTATGDNEMQLELKNFAFGGETLGDILIPQVALTSVENKIEFVKEGIKIKIANPTEMGAGIAELLESVASSLDGKIENDILTVHILIPEIVGGINVEFVSESSNTQLANEIAGTYTGNLKVILGMNPDGPIETGDEQVILTATGDNEMQLELKNFAFGGEKLGDILIPQVMLTSAENKIEFVKEGIKIQIANPTEMGEGIAELLESVASSLNGNIENGILTVHILIPEIVGGIDVEFVSTGSTVSIQNSQLKKLRIYPSMVENELYITGIDGTVDYVIYDITGHLIKSGFAIETIDVSSLCKGLYFIKVGKYTVKFIKQ